MKEKVSKMFPVFKTIECHSVNENPVALCELPRTYENLRDLIGAEVVLDGRLVECIGVEAFAHMPPFRQGERVGIVYKEIEDKSTEGVWPPRQ